ncbi:MAG: cobalamin biosynthesis protein CobD [Oscillospiraceae bacterium]|nr:cobalamin biosynthesis protein CobD [Oscillospiraceae bacterium]
MLLVYSTLALLLGFVLDVILGDPRGIPHIIVGMGRLIAVLERPLRSAFPKTPAGERAAGRCLVVLMCLAACAATAVLLLIYRLHPVPGVIVEALTVWQLLCMRDLHKESTLVQTKLEAGDLPGARRAVSMIVGRDTEVLDGPGVAKAAVETVAENTSDGVIAPLFWLLILGPLGGLLCKAINTMDSMVGYKNERFLNYGRAAALTDDVVNYVPARLSALLMIAAAALTGQDARNAARIWRRDRRKHASPNSAQTESAVAGALHVALAGDARYFGVWLKKETIGDDDRPVETEDIRRTNRMMAASAAVMLALILIIRCAVILGGRFYAAL